jgi:PKD repeat protein
MDNTPPFSYSLTGTIGTVAAAVASQSAMDGGHGSWAVLYGAGAVQSTSLALAVDEDQANKTERAHTNEQVAYFVISAAPGPGGNLSPSASFSYVPDGLTANFTDTSTDIDGTIVAWEWDFGDGAMSTEQDPTHVYASPGTYDVTLTVTDDADAMDTSGAQAVTVTDQGPNLNVGVATGVTNTGWTTVSLPDSYFSMVIVASPVYASGVPPRVVRIRNASASSFEVRADRADGSITAAPAIDVHYMVVEEGVYTLATHGVQMEAVKYLSTVTDNASSWIGQPRTYANIYSAPVVFGQVMTYNDARHSVFWSHNGNRRTPPTASSLWTGKHVGEDPASTRLDETVAYIVIESGTGTTSGHSYKAALGADSVLGMDDAPPYAYSLAAFPASVAIATQAAMDGPHGSWAVLYGPNPLQGGNLLLAVDEDQIGDAERNHTSENVAYILVE